MAKQTLGGMAIDAIATDTLSETKRDVCEAYEMLERLARETRNRETRNGIGAVQLVLMRAIHTIESY